MSYWKFNNTIIICSHCNNALLRNLEATPFCPYCGEKMKNYHQMPCSCYNIINNLPVCFGTKEKDTCNCGGDKRKCDFYDYVRERANVNS